MVKYENSIETKKRIIDTSIKLFMEKGYEKTTYADICNLANVNQGSIYYHFKKKAALYLLAHETVSAINSRVASELCEATDPAYMPFIIDFYIYWYRYFTDTGFRHLMAEGMGSTTPITGYDDWDSTFWVKCKDFVDDYDKLCTEHKLDLTVCTSIDRSLSVYFRDRTWSCTFHEVAEYELRTFAAIFKISNDVCDNIISRANEILNRTDLSLLPKMLKRARQEI